MTCVYCGSRRFKRRAVDLPLYRDGKIVAILRDIEADVCEQCGEPYFDEEAIERLEGKTSASPPIKEGFQPLKVSG